MSRAIVLIGVSSTRSQEFTKLKGVEHAVDQMNEWAIQQGIPTIIRITDATEKVTVDRIKNAIFRLLDEEDSLEQLIVYFSGHGVVNALNEYWLLSSAPYDGNEAINVTGSTALARAGRVPHVVFVSDACRTATNTVQTGRIDGSTIFPNDPNPDAEQAVDIFYATRLGAPALEISADGEQYVAVYTDVLGIGLRGNDPSLVKDGYIRPRPLKDWLKRSVAERIASTKLTVLVSQSPEAMISSGDDTWLAKFDVSRVVNASGPDPVIASGPATPPLRPAEAKRDGMADVEPEEPATIRSAEAAELMVVDALDNFSYVPKALTPDVVKLKTGRNLSQKARELVRSIAEPESSPLGLEGEQQSGFRVLGKDVSRATCVGHDVRVVPGSLGWIITVEGIDHGAQVLIEFDDGSGTLLPALRDYVGILHLREGVLSEVHYEPSNPEDARLSRSELQLLRSSVHAACSRGVFNLEPETASKLAGRLRSAKFDDPALAVYAAYAYQSIGNLGKVREMQSYLANRRSLRFFDIAMLARDFIKQEASNPLSVVPSGPLLAQGWAFIEALHPRFPQELKALSKYLVPSSLWSQYDRDGVAMLSRCYLSKGVSA